MAIVLLLNELSARGDGGIGGVLRVIVLAAAWVLAALPAGSIDVLALDGQQMGSSVAWPVV